MQHVQRVRIVMLTCILSLGGHLAAQTCPDLPTGALNAESFEDVMDTLYCKTQEVTPGPEADWLKQARIGDWTFPLAATLKEISTQTAADARVAELAGLGVNTLLIHGRHHRRLYGAVTNNAEYQSIRANTKLAIDTWHDVNHPDRKALVHLNLTNFFGEAYSELAANPDWAQQGIMIPWTEPLFCMNNDSFRSTVIGELVDLASHTGLDGYMLDEVHFTDLSCGARHCRDRFTADTGYALPEYVLEGKPYFNRDEPLWRLWLEWRRYSLIKFRAELATALDDANLDVVQLLYSTFQTTPRVQNRGLDVYESSRIIDFPGYEGTDITYRSSRFLHSALLYTTSFARSRDRYSWAQLPTVLPEETEYALHLAAVTGMAPWTAPVEGGFNWAHWETLREARNIVADVAVVFSPPTRDHYEDHMVPAIHREAFLGWCQLLAEAGIFFDPIQDTPDQTPDLSAYSLVILPGNAALTDAMATEVDRYLTEVPPATDPTNPNYVKRAKGRVIASGLLGEKNTYGFLKTELTPPQIPGLNGFIDATGLSYVNVGFDNDELFIVTPDCDVPGSDCSNAVPALSFTGAGRSNLGDWQSLSSTTNLPMNATRVIRTSGLTTDDITNATVFATFQDEDESPAVMMRNTAYGRLVYSNVMLGRIFFEPRLNSTAVVEDWHRGSQPAKRLALGLVEYMLDSAMGNDKWSRLVSTEVGNAPILSSVFSNDNEMVVHYVNTSGLASTLLEGETIVRPVEIPYSRLPDLRLSLRIPPGKAVTNILAYDPDDSDGSPDAMTSHTNKSLAPGEFFYDSSSNMLWAVPPRDCDTTTRYKALVISFASSKR